MTTDGLTAEAKAEIAAAIAIVKEDRMYARLEALGKTPPAPPTPPVPPTPTDPPTPPSDGPTPPPANPPVPPTPPEPVKSAYWGEILSD